MATLWWNKVHRGAISNESKVGYTLERLGDTLERKKEWVKEIVISKYRRSIKKSRKGIDVQT